jgi:outer membrane lipopolysaccharide assembly protein LptE/RlpB
MTKGERRTFQLLRGVGRLNKAIILMLVIMLAGCGYQFGTSAKPGAAYGLTLAVPVFHNDTFEPVLDRRVTEMVRRQFLQADGLTLVNDVSAAPLVLAGRINGYGLQTVSFGRGQVNESRVVLIATVLMKDTDTKKILWQETYRTYAEFLVTADLATNRSRQDIATDEAAQMMAEDIVSRVLEDYGSK